MNMARAVALGGISKNDDGGQTRARAARKKDKKIWNTFKQMARRYDDQGDAQQDYIVNALKKAVKE